MISEIILNQYQEFKTDYKIEVKLIYYKSSGKYYAEGSYMEDYIPLFEIWERVKNMKEHPELRSQWSGIISVDVPDHINAHPHLIIMSKEEFK